MRLLAAVALSVPLLLAAPGQSEPVSYFMGQPFFTITLTLFADDGVAMEQDAAFGMVSFGEVSGELVGVISPQLTVERVEYQIQALSVDYTIGAAQIPVRLNMSGFVAWTNLANNTVTLTQQKLLTTNNVSEASFGGVLETPFGDLPFMVDETAEVQPPSSTRLVCPDGRGLCVGGNYLRFFFDALDSVAIDDRLDSDEATLMDTPFVVVLGETGGVTWKVGVRVAFKSTRYNVPPVPTGPAWILLFAIVAVTGQQLRSMSRRAGAPRAP